MKKMRTAGTGRKKKVHEQKSYSHGKLQTTNCPTPSPHYFGPSLSPYACFQTLVFYGG